MSAKESQTEAQAAAEDLEACRPEVFPTGDLAENPAFSPGLRFNGNETGAASVATNCAKVRARKLG